MADPVVLRVNRPYASVDEYLAAESWSIDDKSILLIDEAPLPRDTLVRFEVVLTDGSRPVRAEGKVTRVVPAAGGRPGGLKVRFRRFGASTKEFLERVMAARRKERRASRRPPEQPLVLDADDIVDAIEAAIPEAPPLASERPKRPPTEPPPAEAPADDQAEALEFGAPITTSGALTEPAPPVGDFAASRPLSEPSGVHDRRGPIAPPANREELLERLRERTRRLGK